jgi:hypothetical protein
VAVRIACALGLFLSWGWPAYGSAQEVTLRLLDAANGPLEPERDALAVSQLVTNGDTWSRTGFGSISPGRSDVRVEVIDPRSSADTVAVSLDSLAADGGGARSRLQLLARRFRNGGPYRSEFVRLVGDETDRGARGVEGRVLRVALRDRVSLRYADQTAVYRVGRPGGENGAEAARQARLRVHVLRRGAGEPAVIGNDDADALRLVREQLRVANEVWLQCQLTFGEPSQVPIDVLDPPGPTLLAISDKDGLPARGGGELAFTIDGQSIGPIATRAGATPVETGRDLVRAIVARGFDAELTENLRTRYGAGASADILIRRRSGQFVTIAPRPAEPLSTDARQKLSIGSVDLRDGLREFDNSTAQVGTLEERTLLKGLSDDDPSTIDLFIVSRFEFATRQGEAFIAAGRGPIANAVIIDRNGLRQAPLAWTLAHEIGHVLLDDPMHPDNVGPDRPWLLMDADNGRGTVNGPKRLRPEECARVRRVSANARAPLLVPYDVEPPPLQASSH